MDINSKILVLGARGMVGSAIVRELKKLGYSNLLTPTKSDGLDLLVQTKVKEYFEKERPDYVFLAAARVGGIVANNTYRADFIYENLLIEINVIHSAHLSKVKKLLFLGSSCIYPKMAPQPLKEEYLLTAPLEWTNEPYAIAKIAGLKLCENYKIQYNDNFFSVMPTNLYGMNDNYDEKNSHVIPGLIARMYKAKMENKKVFEAWGTGRPKREFLYVDDLAEATVFLMNQPDSLKIPGLLNVGTGEDITIKDLAAMVAKKLKFNGDIVFNSDIPDGTPRKVLDVSKVNSLGWKAKINLDEGLNRSIGFFLKDK